MSGLDVTLLLAETRTGRVVQELPYTALSWGCPLNDWGDLDATIPLTADELRLDDGTRIDLRERTQPWRWSLAAVEDTTVRWFGPITNRPQRDLGGPTRTLHATEVGAILDRRLLLAPGNGGAQTASADVTITGSTLRHIARGIVDTVVAQRGGPSTLPLVLPDAEPGSTVTRTYPGYDLATAGERLLQLTAVDGGPDVRFDGVLSADMSTISWVMRAGNPLLGQVGDPIVLDPRTDLVRSLTVVEDVTSLASTVYVPGNGSERGRIVGFADRSTIYDAGWPALDIVVSQHGSVSDFATVQSYARSYADAYQYPVERWSVVLDATADEAKSLRPGDTVLIPVDGDAEVRTADYLRRVTATAWDVGAGTVTLTTAPSTGRL